MTWLRRPLVGVAVVVALVWVAEQLVTPYVEPQAAVGSAGSGAGTFPVVEVAGLGSDGTGYASLTARLTARGVPVLDFDPAAAGVQPLVYQPSDRSVHVAELAEDTVAPAIAAALARAGYPADQRIDVVTHSTGGLLVRHLVEQVPGWAAQVDDLVLVAVPDHGSNVVWLETRGDALAGLGTDMRPGSAFLRSLGYAEPPGEVYTTIGGDAALFRYLPWLGWGTGFDDQVPATSPRLAGAANSIFSSFHGRLLDRDDVVALIVATLRLGG